jgi:hypothetical protein
MKTYQLCSVTSKKCANSLSIKEWDKYDHNVDVYATLPPEGNPQEQSNLVRE